MSDVKAVRAEKHVNTRRLQIFELNTFMLEEHQAIFDGVGFTSPVYEVQYSFAQAVELFNTRENKFDGALCDKVKLRYCKKQKRIICTSHLIKLVDEFVAEAGRNDEVPFEAVKGLLRTFRLR